MDPSIRSYPPCYSITENMRKEKKRKINNNCCRDTFGETQKFNLGGNRWFRSRFSSQTFISMTSWAFICGIIWCGNLGRHYSCQIFSSSKPTTKLENQIMIQINRNSEGLSVTAAQLIWAEVISYSQLNHLLLVTTLTAILTEELSPSRSGFMCSNYNVANAKSVLIWKYQN